MLLNFFYLVVGHGFYKATALLSLILLAHYLGSVDFGRFVVALAATQLAEYVSDFGVNQAVVREGAGRPEHFRREFAGIVPLKIVLAFVTSLVAVALIALARPEWDLIEITFYFALGQSLSALTGLLRATFQAFERMEFEALSVALEGSVRLGAVAFAVLAGFGVLGIAKIFAVAAFVVFSGTLLVMAHRFLRPTVAWSWHRARRLLLIGVPFSLVWLALAADQRINSLVLARIAGNEAVAFFGAAVRLTEPALIIPSVFAVAFFPVAVRHDRAGLRTFGVLVVSTQKALLLIGMPLLIVLWFAAPVLISVIFGAEFAQAVLPLQILAPVVVLLFARIGLAQALLAIGRWRSALAAQLAGLGLDLVVAFALIPFFAEVGAAVALLCGNGLAVAACWYVLREHLDRQSLADLGRPLLVAGCAALAALAFSFLSVGIALVASAGTYLATMRAVRVFTARDAGYIRAAFPPLASAISFAVASDR